MKKIVWAVLAAIAYYVVKQITGKKEIEPQAKSHHVTNVFSKAKEHAVNTAS